MHTVLRVVLRLFIIILMVMIDVLLVINISDLLLRL